ncbi:MAG: low temperature requirement protein A, partial [Povalibacter sp.]
NFQRISAWHVVIGALWIYGASLEGTARLAVWGGTVLFECAGPSVGFLVPGLGRSATLDWKVDGAHMAERCALFVIIALGESILVTGATAASVRTTLDVGVAFVAAFLGTVAMWWIYFNIGAERGSRQITAESDSGRMARGAYTYTHVMIIAGIVVGAVGDELIIKHPHAAVELRELAVLIGSPVLYLFGNSLFKRASAEHFPLSHWVGLGLLGVCALVGPRLSMLTLGVVTSGVLIVVATWETLSLQGTRRAEQS